MTAAAVLTYNILLEQIPSYCERAGETQLIAQLPMIIMLAENRLAADMKQQGFQSVVTGTFGGPVMAKPAFWRSTISFNYRDPVAGWLPVDLRSLEYLKNYWPVEANIAAPLYYADYNATNFLIAPSPNAAYEFELAYYARLQPLSSSNGSNWLTVNAPQTLLYACIFEAQLWSRNLEKATFWKAQYEDQKNSIVSENAERLTDRNEVVTRA